MAEAERRGRRCWDCRPRRKKEQARISGVNGGKISLTALAPPGGPWRQSGIYFTTRRLVSHSFMTSIYRQRETYQKQSVDAPHDNVNSLPAPPPTVALQSHKCTVKSIRACICILPTVEGHMRMAQHQSPSLSPKQQRLYMEADFEGLDPEVSPTRRQLHDRKLKLGIQF